MNQGLLLQTGNLKSVIQKFKVCRETTEEICRPLEIEDYMPQPVVDVSPPKWHLAHTTWFFETFILKKFFAGYKPFHPDFNTLFNSYYNAVGDRTRRDRRGFLSRPTVKELYTYRAYVNTHILSLADQVSEIEEQELLSLLEIGCQHEQQHQELLVTDLKYILSCNVITPVYHSPQLPYDYHCHAIPSQFLKVEEGVYDIGYSGEGFCFDNEQEPHRVFLQSFGIQNRLVTNGEYLQFMEDGGYTDFRHWLSEGWEMVNTEGWKAPLYWEKEDGEWHTFSLLGQMKVEPQAPVTHISFYEALAYATWAGKRLLTEFEWEVAAKKFNPQMKADNTLDSKIFHPLPARAEGGLLCHQLFGETWQWTNSAYLPYPGFKIAEGALGEYNGKFMMNQMVLRGASCATPRNHMRPTYRNFFPAYARWQFTGIRLAE